MNPLTLYVVTAWNFNHASRHVPIDSRLQMSNIRRVFYFVDATGAPEGFRAPYLEERHIMPSIQEAGRKHLAEWSFLLAEYKKGFASYPFFMISSRFYEKNAALSGSLDNYEQDITAGIERYGFGYLPSYNRRVNFVSFKSYQKTGVLGIRDEGIELLNATYNVDFMNDCEMFSDFFCNYIGFSSRQSLKDYVEFYLPFLYRFFDEEFVIRNSYDTFVNKTGGFREEKPLTLLLETASHLFFWKSQTPFYGLTYDNHVEVDERRARIQVLKPHISV